MNIAAIAGPQPQCRAPAARGRRAGRRRAPDEGEPDRGEEASCGVRPNAPGPYFRRPAGNDAARPTQPGRVRSRRTGSDRGQLAERPYHRSDDEPEDREAEHRAERLAAPLARRAERQPGERAGPGHRAREPLEETGDAESDRGAGEREGEARDGEHEQPDHHRALRPDPGRQSPPGFRRSSRLRRRRRPGDRPGASRARSRRRRPGRAG